MMSFRVLVLFAVAAVGFAGEPQEVLLWPNGAPGSEGKTGGETFVERNDGVRRVAGIHKPSITAHLPAPEKATGAAVLILPGGAHQYLSIDNEGHHVAKWLAERGIAGLVVKYRLAREAGSTYKVEVEALRDTQRAIRVARSRAQGWNLDPERIGVMGFSAGGQLAALASARFDTGETGAADTVERQSSRPSFQALIYSGGIGADIAIPRDAPPAFLCAAFDDRGPARTSVELFQKLRDAGVKGELHLYSVGGHGFGMRDRPLPITSWPSRFHDWMRATGLLGKVSAVAQ